MLVIVDGVDEHRRVRLGRRRLDAVPKVHHVPRVARRLEDALSTEQEELEALETKTGLSTQQQERLERVHYVLSVLQTAEGIYMEPMLTAQISYLFNMINAADQAPGQEAESRFAELRQQFQALSAEAAGADD